ncbi:MAG TPA: glycosyltransferase 87 family protein [Kineosporiaceae bacterium]
MSVALGWWQKYPCNNGHSPPDYGWSHVCYTDVLPLYSGRGLGDGHFPAWGSRLEYPVLIGVWMALIGLPVHALNAAGQMLGPARALGFETVDAGIVFFWANSVASGVLVLLTTWLLYRMRRDRPGDVVLWAAAPSMALAFTVNWDMLAVTPAVAALLAWSRRRPVWAGVLIGLGTAAKLYPVLLLLPIVLLALRAGHRAARRGALAAVGAAVATWGGVNLPFAVHDPSLWWEPYRFSMERWIDWGSLYFLLDHLSGAIGQHDAVLPAISKVPDLNRTSLLLFCLACAAIAALVRFAPQPPRLAAIAFLAVAAFLVTNKVWSQQFVLWLGPLVVLARPRRRAWLGWQAIEVAYLCAFLRVVIAGKDDYVLVQTALARYLAVVVLAVLVAVDALQPDRDVVRGDGGADPDAGLLARPAEGGPAGRGRSAAADRSAPELVPADAEVPEELTEQR